MGPVVVVVTPVLVMDDAARVDVAVEDIVVSVVDVSTVLAEAGEKEPAEIKVEAGGGDAVVVNVALVVDVVVGVVDV